MLKKIFDPTLFRFLLVGVVNTLVGYGVMFGLYNLAGLHLWGDPGYWISSAANYLVGSVVSFFSTSTSPSAAGRRAPAWCSASRPISQYAGCWPTAWPSPPWEPC